jgi:hypothetical protein
MLSITLMLRYGGSADVMCNEKNNLETVHA